MLLRITNVARDYAWGSKTLIPEYFGVAATGAPMAEIWFGTHSGSPARVVGSNAAAGAQSKTLRETIGHDLSFLLKILAAETPLSIQAHPTSAQAAAGFARENAAGLDLLSPNRNYKDAFHKPEMLIALTDFQALCGFKPASEIDAILGDFAEIPSLSEGFRETAAAWRKMLAEGGIAALIADVLGRRDSFIGFTVELAALAEFEAQYELAAKLNQLYPGDPGVLIALLMNHIWLEPGQAIYLGAGEIHAYVSGLGVEIMASSDNVMRGGLTEKHIDIAELTSILNYDPKSAQLVETKHLLPNLIEYLAPISDFKIYRAELAGELSLSVDALANEAIVLATAGEVSVIGADGQAELLHKCEAVYVDASSMPLKIDGTGTAFIATGPVAK